MDHPRSKLPAVLAILFCIALLGGVGVLLWKTLPEKQQPQQAETIQTDSVFSSEQTAVEPEREAPYEGELPEQAEAAQPEQPDSEQPSEPAADPAAPDDAPVTDAQKTAQATLASMTEDEKLWQLFFVTPEAITNVNTATVAGEATKNALAQYPVGGIVYFAKNLEDRAQAAALLANTQSYAKIPLFLGVDEEGGTVSRIGANEALGGTKVADMRSFGQSADPAQVYAAGQTLAANLTGLGFNLDFAPDCDVVSGVDSVIGSRSFGSDPELCASLAGVIVKSLRAEGVVSCLKHFPGYGSATVDDHNGTSIVEKTLDELESCDLVPFQSIIAQAKQEADFVIVFPHWGTEDELSPDESQLRWAQEMADAGADLIIGGHPHTLQPTGLLTAADGRDVLVYYSLGNFLSHQKEMINLLGGMASVTIVKDKDGTRVEEYELKPTINVILRDPASGWYDYRPMLLEDYTPELAAQNRFTDCTVEAMQTLYEDIVG